jgi:hypothetical protein
VLQAGTSSKRSKCFCSTDGSQRSSSNALPKHESAEPLLTAQYWLCAASAITLHCCYTPCSTYCLCDLHSRSPVCSVHCCVIRSSPVQLNSCSSPPAPHVCSLVRAGCAACFPANFLANFPQLFDSEKGYYSHGERSVCSSVAPEVRQQPQSCHGVVCMEAVKLTVQQQRQQLWHNRADLVVHAPRWLRR